ncbi:uncharacterized protein [Triticum aestivum]|uniref:uncharacterized protein n=1 Tax=Triticum aestivum TaxID=4565 RepID=UPI001D00C17E|nr:uncharacterized protein LOC123148740 [Triticum aestivum]
MQRRRVGSRQNEQLGGKGMGPEEPRSTHPHLIFREGTSAPVPSQPGEKIATYLVHPVDMSTGTDLKEQQAFNQLSRQQKLRLCLNLNFPFSDLISGKLFLIKD